jgi:hypothetical protein
VTDRPPREVISPSRDDPSVCGPPTGARLPVRNPTPSRTRLLVAWVRMPLVALAVVAFVVAAVLDLPG